jgi:hypothetical protein
VREQAHDDIRLAAETIAYSAGAKAKVSFTRMYDRAVNNEALTARMGAVLQRASDGRVGGVPCVVRDPVGTLFGELSDAMPGGR